MVKSLNQNHTCPYCRAVLDESRQEEEDDENDFDDENDVDEQEEEQEEEEQENETLLNTIVDRFTQHGLILKDAIAILANMYNNKNKKYNKEYFDIINTAFDEIFEECLEEDDEQNEMAKEDHPWEKQKNGMQEDL
jgi:hypothetical protein